MIEANPHIAALAPFALPDISAPPGKQLISLAQNESALSPSPRAVTAGQAALTTAQLYTDGAWTDLRSAIADVHGLNDGHILCGGGSMDLIACVMRCYAGPGDTVLASQYAYAFLRNAALAAGASYSSAPEKNFTVSIDALLDKVDAKTRIVCVVNPGNPTGTRLPRGEIVRLRDTLGDDVLLLIDEAYGEFTGDNREHTFDLTERGNTIVSRTFSKAYGLAGMRVGWGVFPPGISDEVRKLLIGNNVSAASEAAATAAMRDQDYMSKVCQVTAEQRDRFADRMRALGFTVPESHTNFVLIQFDDADAATNADRMLRAEGVVMRGMAGYGLPDCLRATIGSERDMTFALQALESWRNKKGNRS